MHLPCSNISKKHNSRDLLANPAVTANLSKLRKLAHLASQLGFESPKITVLSISRAASPSQQDMSPPLLVTEGLVGNKKSHCRILCISTYKVNHKHLFMNYLHNSWDNQSENITSFFQLRCMYQVFYDLNKEIDQALQAAAIPVHHPPRGLFNANNLNVETNILKITTFLSQTWGQGPSASARLHCAGSAIHKILQESGMESLQYQLDQQLLVVNLDSTDT